MKLYASTKSSLLVLLAAVLYSGIFTMTSAALDAGLSTSLVLCGRGLITALACFAVFFKRIVHMKKSDFKNGMLLGLVFFIGSYFQVIALDFTTPSINAFITASSVVLVPFIDWIFFKRKPTLWMLTCAIICLFGAAVLTNFFNEHLELGKGELFSVLSMLPFAIYMAWLGDISKKNDPAVIVFLISMVMGIFGAIMHLTVYDKSIEKVNWISALISMLFLGIVCSFMASYFQVAGIKNISATSGAIIISTESVFASILSILLKFENVTKNLIFGGTIILISVILTQIKPKRKKSIFPVEL